MNRSIQTLGKMVKGQSATIIRVGNEGLPPDLIQRMMEMGFLEGSAVEVVHEAPIGRDPVVVRVRGSLIALRRNEANAVEVSLEKSV